MAQVKIECAICGKKETIKDDKYIGLWRAISGWEKLNGKWYCSVRCLILEDNR